MCSCVLNFFSGCFYPELNRLLWEFDSFASRLCSYKTVLFRDFIKHVTCLLLYNPSIWKGVVVCSILQKTGPNLWNEKPFNHWWSQLGPCMVLGYIAGYLEGGTMVHSNLVGVTLGQHWQMVGNWWIWMTLAQRIWRGIGPRGKQELAECRLPTNCQRGLILRANEGPTSLCWLGKCWSLLICKSSK